MALATIFGCTTWVKGFVLDISALMAFTGTNLSSFGIFLVQLQCDQMINLTIDKNENLPSAIQSNKVGRLRILPKIK